MLKTLLIVLFFILLSAVVFCFGLSFRYSFILDHKDKSESSDGTEEKTDENAADESVDSNNDDNADKLLTDNSGDSDIKKVSEADDDDSADEFSGHSEEKTEKTDSKKALNRKIFQWKLIKQSFTEYKLFSVLYLVLYIVSAVFLAIFGPDNNMNVISVVQSLVLLQFVFIIASIDYRLKKIPNKLILILLIIRLVGIAGEIVYSPGEMPRIVISSLVGFLVGGLFMLVCALISRGGVGAGDVKLYAAIGMYFGLSGILEIMTYSLVLAAVISIGLLIFKRAKVRSTIPMAPFIAVGTALYLFFLYA